MLKSIGVNLIPDLEGIHTITGTYSKIIDLKPSDIQDTYTLSFELTSTRSEKNYFMLYYLVDSGQFYSFFVPMQFLGKQSVTLQVPFKTTSILFNVYGNVILTNTSLKAVIPTILSDEQVNSLDKVTSNSEYWDRILEITNNLGQVNANKITGAIDTANATISGGRGTITWEDGALICRDGSDDTSSTMAIQISGGGFRIANAKDRNGWVWKTFGTGNGFIADCIISGTLDAIKLSAAQITGSTITSGTINGAKLTGGMINIADRFLVDSNGDVQMKGTVSWGEGQNNLIQVKYSSNGTSWHYSYESIDIWCMYSYDGGLTWTPKIRIRGTDGADGTTSYTWIAYATGPSGENMIPYPDEKSTYIGIAPNKPTPYPEPYPKQYTWSLIKGNDGNNGYDGADGVTYYTWIRYADTPTTGMSASPTNKAYMGIAYNKLTNTPSNVYSDYAWSLIKGADGSANLPGYITSTKITGTTIESCTLTGNTIKSSTIIGGDEKTVYSKISPIDPLAVYRQSGKIAELWGTTDGSSYLNLFTRLGVQKTSLRSGANVSSESSLSDTGSFHLNITDNLTLSGHSGIYMNHNQVAESSVSLLADSINIGRRSLPLYLDGSSIYMNGRVTSYNLSELELRALELEHENKRLARNQSELEVTLMEKGIL